MFWYRTQTICVKWGRLCSFNFGVSKGVRQGGIFSPRLFHVDVHGLSLALSGTKTGCIINENQALCKGSLWPTHNTIQFNSIHMFIADIKVHI